MDPLATVVVTTHNRPAWAQRAVRSALTQTVHDLEVVVVDDGSDPPFVAESDDERLRVIRQHHATGVCAARNRGLGEARGTWITFLDDDDVLVPDMLRTSIDAAERSELPEPVAVMSAVTVLGLDGEASAIYTPADALRRGEDFFLERRGSAGRACNSLVAPTAVLRSIGGFDERLEAFQHGDLGLRLNAVASIQGLRDSLYRMTTHRAPRVSARTQSIPRDMERTLAKHPAAFARHRAAHAHFMGTTGIYHLKAGHWLPAVRWCLRAVLRDPTQRRLWEFTAASVCGPYVLGAYRAVRRPGADVSFRTLTRRRVRKYSRRLANYPRWFVGAPLAYLTDVIARRNVRVRNATASGSVLVLCVYRDANAGRVASLVDEANEMGWDVRLWALDRCAPELDACTVGTSSGAKFPLLNRLADGQVLDGFDWLVVADDDFVFDGGSLRRLLAVADAADLDLVQPAHSELSHRDHEITVRRPMSLARRTGYVEIGPMFAIRGKWITEVLPFPPDHEMGWGLEVEWHDLVERGARLGIVDAVTIHHLGQSGRAYSHHDEHDRMRAVLSAHGLSSLREIQCTLDTWRPWQARPPWCS